MNVRHNYLPGVPLIESPFFEDLFDHDDPVYSIASSLRHRGYAVVDFPDEDIAGMAARMKVDLNALYDWESWNAGRSPDMRQMDAWRFNEDVKRIACNRQIMDWLTSIYGRPAFPFQTLNFPVGTQQHYHSDAVHFSSLPERFMCGVWLALEDVGPSQGPLIYYLGSHQWPIYTRQHIGERYTEATGRYQGVFEPLWERLVESHGIAPEAFFPRKGQALIWAANLLHGGDRHHDRQATRWSQVTHYYFDDCVYYSPLASNEPNGEYHQRAPTDILTGVERASSYLGRPVEQPRARSDGPGSPPPDFDKARYLSLHPDVAAAGMDAWEHYVNFGRAENRKW